MANSSENVRPGYVQDPHTGKVYNLNPLFDYLQYDLMPLEELHYRFSDAINDVVQGTDIHGDHSLALKNLCFMLQNLSEIFRPASLFQEE